MASNIAPRTDQGTSGAIQNWRHERDEVARQHQDRFYNVVWTWCREVNEGACRLEDRIIAAIRKWFHELHDGIRQRRYEGIAFHSQSPDPPPTYEEACGRQMRFFSGFWDLLHKGHRCATRNEDQMLTAMQNCLHKIHGFPRRHINYHLPSPSGLHNPSPTYQDTGRHETQTVASSSPLSHNLPPAYEGFHAYRWRVGVEGGHAG
ncbi:hypothetical protein BKA56DRAFT_656162 [Ilyonectria sp. MPI-CAGE-AT-0026]|nr:hypothetical protein BKA56DRAFT_656162 [Ilyonectria sp. MPI-CAGE-AT-0026]